MRCARGEELLLPDVEENESATHRPHALTSAGRCCWHHRRGPSSYIHERTVLHCVRCACMIHQNSLTHAYKTQRSYYTTVKELVERRNARDEKTTEREKRRGENQPTHDKRD